MTPAPARLGTAATGSTATCILLVAMTACAGGSSRSTSISGTASVLRTQAAQTSSAARDYPAGIYVVGRAIAPGSYHTSGATICYWARLSSVATQAVIANGAPSGPQMVRVEATDAALEIGGDCTFSLTR